MSLNHDCILSKIDIQRIWLYCYDLIPKSKPDKTKMGDVFYYFPFIIFNLWRVCVLLHIGVQLYKSLT